MSLLLIVVLPVVWVIRAGFTSSYFADITDEIGVGMVSLAWPLVFIFAIVLSPLWLVGRAGQWLYDKRNAR